ncbi:MULTISPECIES: hypothetical protein [Mesorhizobium]|uniref:hypothetical protein n=1 Tax=Mesorhizobium TaxID=68287 RepID=UPI0007A94C9A|nr:MULTISPECIES: hypothetical protein [Mesorhizobium]AMX93665.1 hypothetical protein A4R28_11430 [Mesorhizobium ciceri]MDF3208358.1 hypothetical protein [Mesorhizobium sp. LMG15046]MDF3229070.1 hypothetical protein [Mesorhizobium sp. DSM 30133]RUU22182.1 hypothetical protein EOC84_03460 [Mesorhizobium sp. Primo-B]RUU37908.1 hypothetical protein EOC83_16755 [Mesorhizobium sp. Primo-A]
MTEVHVVMGNDFPAAVFEKAEDAEACCVARRAENEPGYTRIHWRVYNFPLLRRLNVDAGVLG